MSAHVNCMHYNTSFHYMYTCVCLVYSHGRQRPQWDALHPYVFFVHGHDDEEAVAVHDSLRILRPWGPPPSISSLATSIWTQLGIAAGIVGG